MNTVARCRMPSLQTTSSSGAVSFCHFLSNVFNVVWQVQMSHTQPVRERWGLTLHKGGETAFMQIPVVGKGWAQLSRNERWETFKTLGHANGNQGKMIKGGEAGQVVKPPVASHWCLSKTNSHSPRGCRTEPNLQRLYFKGITPKSLRKTFLGQRRSISEGQIKNFIIVSFLTNDWRKGGQKPTEQAVSSFNSLELSQAGTLRCQCHPRSTTLNCS